MPKNMIVDPVAVRKSGLLEPKAIPLNQYRPNYPAELARFGAEGLTRLWIDMVTIREFETMLNAIKTKGTWSDSPTTTRARPTSPSARRRRRSAWRSAWTPDDHIFGSHRSHGEILAKGLSAIAQARRARAAGDHGGLPRRRRPCAWSRR